jgi:hypothetical protein
MAGIVGRERPRGVEQVATGSRAKVCAPRVRGVVPRCERRAQWQRETEVEVIEGAWGAA